MKTVLLAEEDPAIRASLATELRDDGYRVVSVGDGLKLCDYLELARFSRGRVPAPDLIISDVDLTGYGGVEICRMVAAEDDAPVILIAPTDNPHTWENAERAGAATVVNKPIRMRELLEAVACFLEQR
jgi:DNA-binding response OmpR family regulator